PPISTLFPYTTLFRSPSSLKHIHSCCSALAATAAWEERRQIAGRHPRSRNSTPNDHVRFRRPPRPLGKPAWRSACSAGGARVHRSEEHTSELQSRGHL